MLKEKYEEVYFSEILDHIRTLNDILLNLEKDPKNEALIMEALRIFHSIKGDSAVIGMDKIAEIAHEGENLLISIKENKSSINKEILNKLLNYIDEIDNYLGLIYNKNKNTFKIIIYNNFKEELKIIKSFLIIKTLAEIGNLISIDPPYDMLSSGNVPQMITAVVSVHDTEKLKENLLKIEGITSVEIHPLEKLDFNCNEAIAASDRMNEIEQLISTVESGTKENTGAIVDLIRDKYRLSEIRVNVKSLDKLFNLVGELVLAKSRLNNIVKSLDSNELKEIQRFLEGVVNEIQNEIMSIRLIPIGQVFGVFRRMVRDLSKEFNKEIDLIIQGEETAVDRKILEELIDPVIHIIRNAVDHGIESPSERLKNGKNATGTIKINAYREASNFILDIEDDGKGIDPKVVKERAVDMGLISRSRAEAMSDEEALYLICMPGFTTKERVSKISGRGVGMSAVKSKIEAMGGSLIIKSIVGLGTKITIRLPASMAMIKILVVKVGEQCYSIPLSDVIEIVQLKEVKYIKGQPFMDLRGKVIRLFSLSELLGIKENRKQNYVVIVKKADDKEFGFLVSDIVGEDEITMRPFPQLLQGTHGLLGASILGDGKPTFIIDVMTLV
ncbi:MAG: chemotaxis protein CheA [Candidatus Methanomethyliaceae archaeon]|nr:chemotaxis protein CheA [Candidatus Methanomethyliaceae archaeon]MDW7971484.1 chemotaxis protein CheA [Nitrososphaerota archaeon]